MKPAGLTRGGGGLGRLLLLIATVLSAPMLRADEEDDILAVLRSGADAPAKCDACVRLKVIGTAKAVPVLASLLGEDRISQAARHALETLPGPEADAALRAALPALSGVLQVGVVDSLGRRGDAAAVPLLVPLLANEDAVLASAAAHALGAIGGTEAVAGLTAAREGTRPEVQLAMGHALLACADRWRSEGDLTRAVGVYADLWREGGAVPIRAAAWRGLVLADPSKRVARVTDALAGEDRVIRAAAAQLIRELGDAAVLDACLGMWTGLAPEAQLALLDAHLKSGQAAMSTVRLAMASPHETLRVAAWEALSVMNDPATIPALAQAASGQEASEREAARETLARLNGPGMREALLTQMEEATPPEQAELLRALGARGDRGAGDLLVRHARASEEIVRLAALESLQILALPETLGPLLAIAAAAAPEEDVEPVLKALHAVGQAGADKDEASRKVVEAMSRMSADRRVLFLPLLAELGTVAALEAVQAAVRDSDADLAKEAVTVLGQWPDAAPAGALLELARSSAAPVMQVLAVRACINLAGKEEDPDRRVRWLGDCLEVAKRPEEKRQAISQLGQVPTAGALALVLQEMKHPAVVNEAALAAVGLAERLMASQPELARDAAGQILAVVQEPGLVRRAEALRR